MLKVKYASVQKTLQYSHPRTSIHGTKPQTLNIAIAEEAFVYVLYTIYT